MGFCWIMDQSQTLHATEINIDLPPDDPKLVIAQRVDGSYHEQLHS